jgi:peptide alpha-N-acetyltransferase
MESAPKAELVGELRYIQYQHSLEAQYLPAIRALISKDLSEPYSIYVYRYFLSQWGHLCFMVGKHRSRCPQLCLTYFSHQALNPADSSLIGVIVCKLELHTSHSPQTLRGYIAMLAVSTPYRGHGVATALVKMAIDAMAQRNADEIVLETEETNIPAMRLYERLGFLRSKKLHRYYLNGNSAYRLVLLLKPTDIDAATDLALDEDDVAQHEGYT